MQLRKCRRPPPAMSDATRLCPPRGCDPMQGGPPARRPRGPTPTRHARLGCLAATGSCWACCTPGGSPARGAGPATGSPSIAATATPSSTTLCARCRRVFNAWTGTVLQGTQRPLRLHLPDPVGDRLGDPGRADGPRPGVPAAGPGPDAAAAEGPRPARPGAGAVRRGRARMTAPCAGRRRVNAGSVPPIARTPKADAAPGPRAAPPRPRSRPAGPPPGDPRKPRGAGRWHQTLERFPASAPDFVAIPASISMWGVDIQLVDMQSVGRDCLMNRT